MTDNTYSLSEMVARFKERADKALEEFKDGCYPNEFAYLTARVTFLEGRVADMAVLILRMVKDQCPSNTNKEETGGCL